MSEGLKIRWGWLKFMYLYTAVVAGGFGCGILIVPGAVRKLLGLPDLDPLLFGIMGSVFVAFGVLSIGGLRSPLRFVPVLFLQLCYKLVWLLGVVLPLLISGRLPAYSILPVTLFVSFVVGDLIAIPFPYLFPRRRRR